MVNSFRSLRCIGGADMGPATASSFTAGILALAVTCALLRMAQPRARTTHTQPASAHRTTALPPFRQAFQRAVASTRQRRRARGPVPPEAVATWCDAIARRLRSGEALRRVLANERPVHVALSARTDSLRRSLDRGASVTDAIAASGAVSGNTSLDLVWSVLAVASDYGGSAAEPIDRAASALRLRSADAHERAAQSAQARLSAHVLTAVPLLVLALLLATDPDVRLIVLRTAGGMLVGAGLLLNLCGWAWMRHIVAGQAG
ncbi:type II secretion system F family protein [Ilumatobacter sp.]|uniref:type II secretion system F family protein n=1 Tax=Ilumatobacter sp. TaxID=1967498 RepID=UPI003750456D